MGWVEDKTGIDVTPIQMDEADAFADAVTDAFDGIGDFVGQIGETVIDVAASPIGQIALQMIPVTAPYAKYITAAAKVANGQDLTAADFVSLGIDGMSDFDTGITVPDAVKDAVNVAARISDGADPVTALIGTYGDDFMEVTGLGDELKNVTQNVLGEQGYSFVKDYMDPNQAVADLVAGEQPLRILSNQFGDELVNYMADDDPNMQALGYGGLRTAIGLDEGLDADQAFLRGAEEYYKRGGRLDNLGNLVDTTGLDIDISTPDWLSKLWNNIPEFDLPEGMNWSLLGDSLSSIKDMFSGIDLGSIDWSGINWQELGGSIPDIQLNFPDIDLGSLNWEGIDYDVFQDYSLPELQDMGIDLEGLRLPEITLALKQQQMQASDGGGQLPEDEEEEDLMARTTDNPLLDQEDQLPLSRALLQRTGTLG